MPRPSRPKNEVKGKSKEVPPVEKPQEVKPKYPVLDPVKLAKLVNTVRRSKNIVAVDNAFREIENMLKPRIRYVCSKFNISGLSYDDIYQEARMALLTKAIKDFDPERGSFDSFASLCIRRHLSTELKTSYQRSRRALNDYISLTADRGDDRDSELSLMNIIPQTKGDVLALVENREYYSSLINKLLHKLSSFERAVFLLYIERYTYDEIAQIINRRGYIDVKSNDNAAVEKLKKKPIEGVEEALKKIKRKPIRVKGVDNALMRIKGKAHAIFTRMDNKMKKEQSKYEGESLEPEMDCDETA